jgi:hypothetical protein
LARDADHRVTAADVRTFGAAARRSICSRLSPMMISPAMTPTVAGRAPWLAAISSSRKARRRLWG